MPIAGMGLAGKAQTNKQMRHKPTAANLFLTAAWDKEPEILQKDS